MSNLYTIDPTSNNQTRQCVPDQTLKLFDNPQKKSVIQNYLMDYVEKYGRTPSERRVGRRPKQGPMHALEQAGGESRPTRRCEFLFNTCSDKMTVLRGTAKKRQNIDIIDGSYRFITAVENKSMSIETVSEVGFDMYEKICSTRS